MLLWSLSVHVLSLMQTLVNSSVFHGTLLISLFPEILRGSKNHGPTVSIFNILFIRYAEAAHKTYKLYKKVKENTTHNKTYQTVSVNIFHMQFLM